MLSLFADQRVKGTQISVDTERCRARSTTGPGSLSWPTQAGPLEPPVPPARAIASTLSDKKPVQFHVQCFYVWDAERRAPKS